MRSIKYIIDVVDNDLCCGCGLCAAICPQKLFVINSGKAKVLDSTRCINCSLCEKCCPARGYSLEDSSMAYFQNNTYFLAKSTDNVIRNDSSAGGFITSFLQFLLKCGKVDYVCVVKTGDYSDDVLSKYIVTQDPEDVFDCRKSKYTQASLENVIDHIVHHDASYAIVALPCQWYGLAQYEKNNHVFRKRVKYKIGLVCGYTYEYECLDALLNAVKLNRANFAAIDGWRIGGLPGNFSVIDKQGIKSSIPFDTEHSIDVTFYAQNRCLLCEDCFCQNADLVASDFGGWKNVGTLLLVHKNNIIFTLEEAQKNGFIDLNVFDSSKIENTVVHFMIREKRNKVEKRIRYCENIGLEFPVWVGGAICNLTVAHKISDSFSVNKQRQFKNDRDAYLNIPKKMEKNGRLSYHGIDKCFPIRVLNKAELIIYMVGKIIHKIQNYYFYHLMPYVEKFRPKNEPLKVGIIGLGKWGKNYLRYLAVSPQYKIVVIFDTDHKTLNSLVQKYGVTAAVCAEDIVNNNSLDAVFILTPPSTHEILLEKCTIKQNFYIEKPIASKYEDCLAISKMTNNLNKLYVAHSMKFEPLVSQVKELVDNCSVGKIRYVRLVRSVPNSKENNWRKEIPFSALYNLGVHLLEVMYYIFGKEESISCNEGNNYFSNDADKVDVILHYKEFDARLLCAFDKAFEFVIRIEGESGYIIADGERISICIVGNQVESKKMKLIGDRVIQYEIKDFFDYIRYGKETCNDITHALYIMDTVNKIISMQGEKS